MRPSSSATTIGRACAEFFVSRRRQSRARVVSSCRSAAQSTATSAVREQRSLARSRRHFLQLADEGVVPFDLDDLPRATIGVIGSAASVDFV